MEMVKFPTSPAKPSTTCGQTLSLNPFVLMLDSVVWGERERSLPITFDGKVVTLPILRLALKWLQGSYKMCQDCCDAPNYLIRINVDMHISFTLQTALLRTVKECILALLGTITP